MKLILTADTHIRSGRPRCRRAPALETLGAKLGWMANLQRELDGAPVLCAGDIFHTWDTDVPSLALAFRHIRNWIVTPGQHDLPHHRIEELERSPLHVLEVGGRVEILSDCTWADPLPGVRVYGIPYGRLEEDLPRLISLARQPSHVGFRVLLLHHFVYSGRPPFPGAESLGVEALELIRRTKGMFDLIVTGDHHVRFIVQDPENPRTMLVNPGPIYRTTADEVEFAPAVAVCDPEAECTEDMFDVYRVPISENVEDDFDLQVVELYRRGSRSVHREFTSGLGDETEDTPSAEAPTPESWSAVPFEERLRALLAGMPPEVQAEVRLAWKADVDTHDRNRKRR